MTFEFERCPKCLTEMEEKGSFCTDIDCYHDVTIFQCPNCKNIKVTSD